MRFLGRWLSHSVATALALVLAIAAMQAPTFTRDYANALMQVAAELRRDIDQRETSARQFYGITADQDDDLVQILRAREPSNAQSLARSLYRARILQQAYDDIARASPLLQPLVAVGGAIDDHDGFKSAIWTTSLNSYDPKLELSEPAAIYGLAGLLFGSLIAQSLFALLRAPWRRRSVA